VVALIALVGAACNGDDDGVTPASSSTAPSSSAVSPSSSSTDTTAPSPSTNPGELVVQLFFLDEDAFNLGRQPYVRPVERTVGVEGSEAAALDLLFDGPTTDESAGGLRFVASEATGVAEFRIEERTAHVQLAGGCSSGGSTFTVADQIVATLVQFTSVDTVKIYDTAGETGSPDGPGDSIPFCLEP